MWNWFATEKEHTKSSVNRKIGFRQKEKHVGVEGKNIFLQVSMATWRVPISRLMFSQANSFFCTAAKTQHELCHVVSENSSVSPVKIANRIVSPPRLRGSAHLTHTALNAFAKHFNGHAYSACFCMPRIIFKSTVGTCAWPHCTVQCINTAWDQWAEVDQWDLSVSHSQQYPTFNCGHHIGNIKT